MLFFAFFRRVSAAECKVCDEEKPFLWPLRVAGLHENEENRSTNEMLSICSSVRGDAGALCFCLPQDVPRNEPRTYFLLDFTSRTILDRNVPSVGFDVFLGSQADFPYTLLVQGYDSRCEIQASLGKGW